MFGLTLLVGVGGGGEYWWITTVPETITAYLDEFACVCKAMIGRWCGILG